MPPDVGSALTDNVARHNARDQKAHSQNGNGVIRNSPDRGNEDKNPCLDAEEHREGAEHLVSALHGGGTAVQIRPLFLILYVGQGSGGILLDPSQMEQKKSAEQGVGQNEEQDTKPSSVRRSDPRHLGGQPHREGIGDGRREAEAGRQQTHTQTHQGVQPQREHKEDHNGKQGNELLIHPKKAAEQHEDQHRQTDHGRLTVAHAADDAAHEDLDAAGLFQQIEDTAHDEQEQADHDHGNSAVLEEHAEGSGQHPPRGDALHLPLDEGAHDDLPIAVPFIGTGGDQIGQDPAEDQKHQQHDHNRQKGFDIDGGKCLLLRGLSYGFCAHTLTSLTASASFARSPTHRSYRIAEAMYHSTQERRSSGTK